MRKFLLGIACLFLAYDVDKDYKKYPILSSARTTVSSSTLTPIPPGARKKVVDALIEQVINDPVVHLKYWHWGGHSPDDLAQYIWMKYRNTKWKVTPQEAQVLKSRAIEILDRIYKKKVEKKFQK
jgi:hypothetical protein